MNKLLIALVASTSLWGAAAQAVPIVYKGVFSGAAINPPNASPAVGETTVIYDDDLHTLFISEIFSGLLGNTTASHIHCCTLSPLSNAGVATQVPSFTGFPLGVTSGNYSHTFDLTQLSSFNISFVNANGGTAASAEAALAGGLARGEAYVVIHTSAFPPGEIRANLAAVPEPGTLALLGLGIGMLLVKRRRITDK